MRALFLLFILGLGGCVHSSSSLNLSPGQRAEVILIERVHPYGSVGTMIPGWEHRYELKNNVLQVRKSVLRVDTSSVLYPDSSRRVPESDARYLLSVQDVLDLEKILTDPKFKEGWTQQSCNSRGLRYRSNIFYSYGKAKRRADMNCFVTPDLDGAVYEYIEKIKQKYHIK
jgi:hypothetical protein